MPDLLQATAQYIDSSYQGEYHKNYRLSIQLRLDGFSFAIIDPNTKQLLLLKEYKIAVAPHQDSEQKWFHLYEYFISYIGQNDVVPEHFDKTIVALDHKEYTLLPEVLFQKETQEKILTFSQAPPYSFVTFNNKIPGSDYRFIAAIYKPLFLALGDFSKAVSITHSAMVLQNEIQKLHKNKNLGDRVYVSVSIHDMHIIAVSGTEVVLSNSYSFSSKEDFVYFILLCYDQLKMNTEVAPLYFLGDIGRTSPIYHICWQYIRHIHFVDQLSEMKLGAAFDQMPIHQYYTLIQTALCEL